MKTDFSFLKPELKPSNGFAALAIILVIVSFLNPDAFSAQAMRNTAYVLFGGYFCICLLEKKRAHLPFGKEVFGILVSSAFFAKGIWNLFYIKDLLKNL